MKISGVGPKNRDPRYTYDKPVRLQTGGSEFEQRMAEGTVRDLSLSGVAVSMETSVVENGQFVNMHIEGMGTITGSVARIYEGGAAIAFEDEEDARKRVAATLQKLNQLA